MATVNFECGHCHRLMGVSSEHLGRQVRCPHCQQVVVAPLQQPAAPTSPTSPRPEAPAAPDFGLVETVMQPAPLADPEDIFAPADAADDLFGRPSTPRIEMPPDALAPTLPGDGSVPPPSPVPDTTLFPTVPFAASGEAPPVANGEATLSTEPAPRPADQPAADVTASLPAAEPPWMASTLAEAPAAPATVTQPPAEAIQPPVARAARRQEQGAPWFLILVFSPLVLYSIVVTIFAVLLYLQQRQIEHDQRNPFEIMPDDGDNPGVKKGQKVTRRQRYEYSQELVTRPLPARLRTHLNEPLRIGELEVTPTKVVRKRVQVFVAGFAKPEPCLGDSLVLHLTLKNVSADQTFAPLDNYFDRAWKRGDDQLPPLTLLEAGPNRFYGGPAKWFPRDKKDRKREWVEGRKDLEAELLAPGQEKKDFFVCTDGSDPRAVRVLFGQDLEGGRVGEPYHGALLWRVRLRRGLAEVRGKEYSTTAVVGVEFTDKDITPDEAAAAGG